MLETNNGKIIPSTLSNSSNGGRDSASLPRESPTKAAKLG